MKKKRVIIATLLDSPGSKLNLYANLMGNLYTYFLPEINAEKVRKIFIDFKRSISSEIYSDGPTVGVYSILKSFDFKKFEESAHEKKCELLCDEIYDCLKEAFIRLKIELTPLNVAYAQIKENNYKLRFLICGGAKENKMKSIVGTVVAEHFLEYALLKVNFLFKKDSLNKEVIMCKCDPGYFIYSKLFSSAKWDDSNNFRILNKTKDINLIVNINGNVSIIYDSVVRDENSIREEIRDTTQEVFFQM